MPRSGPRVRLDLLTAIQGNYACEVAIGLIKTGVFDLLNVAWEVSFLAEYLGLDAKLLGLSLDFLERTTDLVERDGVGRYRIGSSSPAEVVFQLQKFVGAYGGSVRSLHGALRGRPKGKAVNESALAAAFSAVGNVSSKVTKQLQQAGCRSLLDIGCGPASLSIEMALADDQFRGIGLDSSNAMCRLAKSRVRSSGVSSRVQIYCADVRQICRLLDPQKRLQIDALHGRSLLNAFFGRGQNAACALLRKLRLAFPGRTAYFVDYYSELGTFRPKGNFRLAQIHDLAQLASGQGIPPHDREGWHSLYRRAGCELLSGDDIQGDDIRWFIHAVRLCH